MEEKEKTQIESTMKNIERLKKELNDKISRLELDKEEYKNFIEELRTNSRVKLDKDKEEQDIIINNLEEKSKQKIQESYESQNAANLKAIDDYHEKIKIMSKEFHKEIDRVSVKLYL